MTRFDLLSNVNRATLIKVVFHALYRMFDLPPLNPSDPDLLKVILEPLLEDFQYWFGRSQTLLESTQVDFLDAADQADLLHRIQVAQQEVSTSKLLLDATDGKAGVDTAVMAQWHRLVHECWQVSMRLKKPDFRIE
jgi:hypothetical protein